MMQRILPVLLAFLFLVLLSAELAAQVGRTARILPRRSFSLGLAPTWYPDVNNIGLDALYPDDTPELGLGIGASARFASRYDMDMGARIIYVLEGSPWFGADMMYLVRVSRYSYFFIGGGLHYWDDPGLDITGIFTYYPRFQWGLTAGLDLDVNYDPRMDSNVRFRAWLPVNVSLEVSDMATLWAEFNLQVSQWSWSHLSLGANINFR